jgi:hypothetical protein
MLKNNQNFPAPLNTTSWSFGVAKRFNGVKFFFYFTLGIEAGNFELKKR